MFMRANDEAFSSLLRSIGEKKGVKNVNIFDKNECVYVRGRVHEYKHIEIHIIIIMKSCFKKNALA
jgi:hypothetical protein